MLVISQPMTTGEIGRELPYLDRTTIMQHLGVLERARLIFSRKEGRCRWNYLDVSPIQRIHRKPPQQAAGRSRELKRRRIRASVAKVAGRFTPLPFASTATARS